jgi:hypothetical protein
VIKEIEDFKVFKAHKVSKDVMVLLYLKVYRE